MKKLFAASILSLGATLVQAGPVATYEITNFNNGNGAHGLWTNREFGDTTFDIDSGYFSIFNDQGIYSATFDAIASNSLGYTAVIDLDLSNFEEYAANTTYKREGGKSLSQVTEDPSALANPYNDDIDFFKTLSGTIDIFRPDNTLFDSFSMMNCCAPVFQFGVGANAKNKTEFGGSAWVNDYRGHANHWDLNVGFAQVSEPGTLALIALGAAGLIASRRRAAKS